MLRNMYVSSLWSAGVGRTGTFIGYDALLRRGKETGQIIVFEFVKKMREDRMTMIQTKVVNCTETISKEKQIR